MKGAWKSLLAHDVIRTQKLLEMAQFSVIYFFIAVGFSIFIRKVTPQVTKEEIQKYSTIELIYMIIMQMCMFIISAYYVHKIAAIFPFVLHITKEYIPNWRRESSTAGGFVIGVFLTKNLPMFNLCTQEFMARANAYFGIN
jgi:hypothetical protein